LKTKKKTGLVFFPAFDWAISPTHPEREERLLYTKDQILEEGLMDIEGIIEYKPKIATSKDVERVHFCVPDVSSICTNSHLISAGGAIAAADAVMRGDVDNSFALVRPPGHHAMRIVHGARGFCNINIEAIMIEHIRQKYGIRRVAIIDTDCHHGDGTENIYWHDPDTLYISMHQDGRTLYPGTGFPQDLGGPNAYGRTINIPLPPGTSKRGFLYALEEIIMPVIKDFKPELIVNSAGQDNHYSDPITNMNFSAQGYAQLTERLNPHIAVLEGGYSIEGALPYVNLGIILALAGLDYSSVIEPDYEPIHIAQSSQVDEYIKTVSGMIWRSLSEKNDGRERLIAGRKTITTERHIYYDTDNIAEKQQEEIMVCDECAGALKIESYGDKYSILAIHLPRYACDKCEKQALQWFDQADKDKFHHVYMQDQKRDTFTTNA